MASFINRLGVVSLGVLALSGVAVAEEVQGAESTDSAGSVEESSEPVVLITLSEWLETEEGRRFEAEVAAQEAAMYGGGVEVDEYGRVVNDDGSNPYNLPSLGSDDVYYHHSYPLTEEQQAAAAAEEAERIAKDRINQMIENCGVHFGSIQPKVGDHDVDVSLTWTISTDDFFAGRFDRGTTTFQAGNGQFGVSANVVTLWNSPEETAECVEAQIDEVVGKITEETDKLMAGDFSTVEKLAKAAVLKLAVDRASELNEELGEALDVLIKIGTMDDPC